VNIDDRAELLSYSELQDHRSRGSAFQNSRRRRLEALDAAQEASELKSRFVGVSDPEQFVILPAPYSLESADRVMALLREIEAGFLERVKGLEPIAHTLNSELALAELEQVRAAYRTLDNVFEGYPD
jgi:hypothetical protein